MYKKLLEKQYLKNGLSIAGFAKLNYCSINKIVYWMDRRHIQRRPSSDAAYQKKHPKGDPFKFRPVINMEDAWLQGLGIGFYWGEGNKANK